MAVPRETIWNIEPHTLAKHQILRNYLNAWFPILSTHHDRVVYLDGFSGPGVYKGGEPGSPIIALKAASTHFRPIKGEAAFIFVDNNAERVTNLENEVAKLNLPNNYKVYCRHGEFQHIVGNILNQIEKDGRDLGPIFAFVDPFGFSGLPFELMKRLLRHRRSEAFITFMVDSVNRWLSSDDVSTKAQIEALFGTNEVFRLINNANDRIKDLTFLYQNQLRKIAKFVRSFEMSDQNGRIIYHLQFVTQHSLGHLKMKEAMWKADSDGDFRFSDATDPGQQVLFRVDHAPKLFGDIQKKFSKKSVDAVVVRNYVRDETGFIDKHFTAAMKYGEQQSLLSVNEKKQDGSARRGGSFSPGTIVTFH